MTKAVRNILLQKTYESKSELIFKSINGDKITRVSDAFERAVKKLKFNDGIKDRRLRVVFHTLRHTFASWHAKVNKNPFISKQLTGHSTLDQMERYSHPEDDGCISAMKAFEDYINEDENNNIQKIRNENIA